MTEFHRDFDGSLDEPIELWTNLELTDARMDPMLTQYEQSQIEMHHGPLNDPYL
ncbi:hypothetical protein [Haloarcula sediminis]|uniref:hypothetical protein n=1 Tax=Haloarcula sediminis TaxID=3111777 RepID=UPI002D77B2B0|nr:hypothetical protein [Haloarcula sp. CK38]